MVYNRVFGLLALVYFALPSAARAEVILEFGQGGNIGLTSFSAVVGESINVDVYISQKGSETRLSDLGIWAMAVEFTIDGEGGATHGDFFQNIPVHFDTVKQELSNGSQVLKADGTNSDQLGLRADANGSIFLGTATVLANQIGIYGFSLTLPVPPGGLSFLLEDPNPDNLVPIIPSVGNATFSVTAVPEPGSLVSIGLCAMIGGLARIRFRKKASSV